MWPSWVFGFFGPRNRLPGINGPKRSVVRSKIRLKHVARPKKYDTRGFSILVKARTYTGTGPPMRSMGPPMRMQGWESV